MHYSVPAPCARTGIAFTQQELEPLAIRPGATCWGLWAEGRDFDERCRLHGDANWLRNDSPQIVLSQIHPDHWPTAFAVQAFLQRRVVEDGREPRECDSLLGLADALDRCGANVLSIQTAQLGYDLISANLICELPGLRDEARTHMAAADRAGRRLEELRAEQTTRGQCERGASDALRRAAWDTHLARAFAFQRLGQLMLPRLVEIEARLIVIEAQRFHWQRPKDPELRRERQRHMLQDASDSVRRALLAGEPGGTSSAESDLRDALASPWFLNQGVVAAGENTYYLAHHCMDCRERARQHPSGGFINAPADALPDRELDVLFDLYHRTLCARTLGRSFWDVIPVDPNEHYSVPASGTAERARKSATASHFEDTSLQHFFARQSLRPLRISALAALAYARFWALGGASYSLAPVEFEYTPQGMLRPKGRTTDPEGEMGSVFRFLNARTLDGRADPRGTFGPGSTVFASVDLRNRSLRLRFVRSTTSVKLYLTIKLEYHVRLVPRGLARPGPVSQGLLREMLLMVVGHHLRIDMAANSIEYSDERNERGAIDLVARAASARGMDVCLAAGSDPRTLEELWERGLRARFKQASGWDKLAFQITPGVARPDRGLGHALTPASPAGSPPDLH